ncbi:MAG: hypothetical protein ACP5H7_02450 [Minisyncoccia bacterium]
MKKEKKFNKNTTLKEVLEKKENFEILLKHHVPCLNCPFASFELENLTLEKITKMYNINLKKLLKDLNEK